MIQKKKFAKEQEQQDIQSDSKRRATMFYPLKVVKEVIVIENDDE